MMNQKRAKPFGEKTFNPDDHPRDAHGEFTKALSKLHVGHGLALPDGTMVHATARKNKGRTERRFKVSQPPGDVHAALSNLTHGVEISSTTHRTAEQAARNALDRTARSGSPASLGGQTRFKDYGDYKRKTNLRTAA
jgi:hypothetical protein